VSTYANLGWAHTILGVEHRQGAMMTTGKGGLAGTYFLYRLGFKTEASVLQGSAGFTVQGGGWVFGGLVWG